MTMGKITKVNPEKKLKALGVKVPKVVVKKDRRTKAELASELDGVRSHNDVLLRQHSIKLLNDGEQFDAGYKSGVKAQQEFEAKNKWWRFW